MVSKQPWLGFKYCQHDHRSPYDAYCIPRDILQRITTILSVTHTLDRKKNLDVKMLVAGRFLRVSKAV